MSWQGLCWLGDDWAGGCRGRSTVALLNVFQSEEMVGSIVSELHHGVLVEAGLELDLSREVQLLCARL